MVPFQAFFKTSVMAHTFTTDGESVFAYNGDFSGDVIIANKAGEQIKIPMSELLGFLRQYVESKKVEKIEQASLDELLNL